MSYWELQQEVLQIRDKWIVFLDWVDLGTHLFVKVPQTKR